MVDAQKDFEKFITLLNEHDVRYLIVGGYALAAHGSPRYTGDLDIWVAKTTINAARMAHVINEFGFESLDLTEEDFLRPNFIHQFGYPPVRIDVLTDIDGVTFNDAWEEKIEGKLGKETAFFISAEDLVKNKKSAGRPQDLVDIRKLTSKKKPPRRTRRK